ncbi:hypothetical protein ACVIW2_000971 [Bradyrhizobium huanghuaihaiense]|uniref:DUF4832 domain-containing protein n=1 Tax=Bradyrhizobium huanghuaihaiense TaxID=990078 RepID=A0A562RPB7_9BRAD|nr:hypothetical protein [Bradyrhizobium huanghuaihaiense]TWI70927.1 hypothetical protein IQ16_03341 [Bradyrhizobium huanghuaihaiense]
MNRRTLGALLAGSLVVATAVLASPVAASLGRESSADSICFGWSRTTGVNNYLDETWWAVRGHDTPDNFVERLLSIAVGAVARGAGAGFETRVSQGTGLPLPESWSIATAKNSPFITSVYAETPRDLAAVLGFYRAELGKRGWIETVVEPDRAVITFTTPRGPVLLRLSRQDDRTIAELSLRRPGIADPGLPPRPRQAKLVLGNQSDEAAVITIADQTIKLPAHAGEKLADSDSAAAEIPDSQKIDLPPGRYKVTLKVDGRAAESRQFEVAANETWGLLAGTDGALLPMRLY